MKKYLFNCLIALSLLSIVSLVSCQEIEPAREEPVVPATPEEILLGLVPESMVDSYSVTDTYYRLLFTEVASFKIRDNMLSGYVTDLILQKESIRSFDIGKDNIRITLTTGETAVLNYASSVDGYFDPDIKIYFTKEKNTAETRFFVKYNSEPEFNLTLEDNEFVSFESEQVSETEWKVILTNKMEKIYSTQLNFSIDNGLVQKDCGLDIIYHDIVFEENAAKIEEIQDGKEHWLEYQLNTNIPSSSIHLAIEQGGKAFDEDDLEYSISENNVLKFLLPENFTLKTCSTIVSLICDSLGVSASREFMQGTYGSTGTCLIAFYNATDGDNWLNNENFGDPDVHMSNWGSVNFSGYGSYCGTAYIYGRKTYYFNDEISLSLSPRGLHGYFPDELFELEKLEILNLFFEDGWITSPISPDISKLKNLESLRLKDYYNNPWAYESGMDLEIIDEIWELPKLQVAEFVSPSRGSYKVNWNSVLTLPKNLHYLCLDGCDFGKDIQLDERLFNNNKDLMVLEISHCDQLSGSLPEFLGNEKNLVALMIYNTALSGPIPTSMGDMTEMAVLDLSDNQLSGEIPESLGYLPNLLSINLSRNHLTGTIPESFINIPCIRDKEVSVKNIYDNIAIQYGEMDEYGNYEVIEMPCADWIKKHYGVDGWVRDNKSVSAVSKLQSLSHDSTETTVSQERRN